MASIELGPPSENRDKSLTERIDEVLKELSIQDLTGQNIQDYWSFGREFGITESFEYGSQDMIDVVRYMGANNYSAETIERVAANLMVIGALNVFKDLTVRESIWNLIQKIELVDIQKIGEYAHTKVLKQFKRVTRAYISMDRDAAKENLLLFYGDFSRLTIQAAKIGELSKDEKINAASGRIRDIDPYASERHIKYHPIIIGALQDVLIKYLGAEKDIRERFGQR